MWVAIGMKTKDVYMISNTKSSLFLRLQKKYRSKGIQSEVYPEPLLIQKRTQKI